MKQNHRIGALFSRERKEAGGFAVKLIYQTAFLLECGVLAPSSLFV